MCTIVGTDTQGSLDEDGRRLRGRTRRNLLVDEIGPIVSDYLAKRMSLLADTNGEKWQAVGNSRN